METIRKKYSLEFKIKAVELAKQRGNLLAVARELNISKETLKNWKKTQQLGGFTSNTIKQRSKEEEENIRLRKELYDIKLERDILKKAVSIFSNKSDK